MQGGGIPAWGDGPRDILVDPSPRVQLQVSTEDVMQSQAKSKTVELVEKLIERLSREDNTPPSTGSWPADLAFDWNIVWDCITESGRARRALREVSQEEGREQVHAGIPREFIWQIDMHASDRLAPENAFRRRGSAAAAPRFESPTPKAQTRQGRHSRSRSR